VSRRRYTEAPEDKMIPFMLAAVAVVALGLSEAPAAQVSYYDVPKGAHPHDVATIIDRSGVAVRAGTHCVMPLLNRIGVTATCRASFALYNTKDEVDSLAQALIKAQDFFA